MANYEDKETKQVTISNEGLDLHEYSRRFLNKVEKEFKLQLSRDAGLTEYQKQLAKNLFIAVNNQLEDLESKRNSDKITPIVWKNIDLQSLYVSAVHRVNLGLDAMLDNHVHPVPYWNKNKGLYTLNLLIGYKGKDYYMRKAALDMPKDIRYELVYSDDHFKPIFKDVNNEVESYEFTPGENPFNRGEIVGGFGYIVYEDATKNKLVLVKPKEFKNWDRGVFWKNNPEKMRLKTIVHRTTSELNIDPAKISSLSLAEAQNDDYNSLEQNQIEKDMQGSEEFDDFDDVSDQEAQEEPKSETKNNNSSSKQKHSQDKKNNKSDSEDKEKKSAKKQSGVEMEF